MVHQLLAAALASTLAYAQFPSSGNVSADGIHNLVVGTDGTIFATSPAGELHDGPRPFLYALDGEDGTVKWSFNGTGGGWNTYRTSVPALRADGTVVATFTVEFFRYAHGHQHIVYAVNGTDGSLKWSQDLGEHSTVASHSDGVIFPPDADTSPSIGADGTVYVGCDTHVFVLDGEDGTLKDVLNFTHYGNISKDYVTSSPALGANGAIFVGTGPNLVATGSHQWTFACGNADPRDAGTNESCYYGWSTIGCPYPWGSSSPALGDDSTVYVSSFEGFTCAVHRGDGSLKWRTQLSFPDENSTEYWRLRPTYCPACTSVGKMADGLVFAPLEGHLYALTAVEGTLQWSYDFGEGQRIQTSPVVDVDGNVIVSVGPDSREDARPYQALGSVLYLLDGVYGSVIWRYDGDVVESPVVDADGSILISDGQSIHRINKDAAAGFAMPQAVQV